MNKFLNLCLMIISLSMLFLYTDNVLAESTLSELYLTAENELTEKEILKGYTDGSVQKDKKVTRAEAVSLLCRAANNDMYIKSLRDIWFDTDFNDVDTEHWAYNNISVAAGRFINGYGDNSFRPDDYVTYDQMLKMIFTLLGYDPIAQANGGYPNGYLYLESYFNITDGLTYYTDDYVSREDAIVMIYNIMDIQIADRNTFDDLDNKSYRAYKGLIIPYVTDKTLNSIRCENTRRYTFTT